MGHLYSMASEVAARIQKICDRKVDLCVILGSGLGAFVDCLEDKVVIPYSDIEGFPRSGVHGHAGNLVFGRLHGQDLVVMQGRIHYYECGDIKLVTLPVRILHCLGCTRMIVTNAAGAANAAFDAGELMLITDHINFMQASSPLVGENDDRFGPRFPDMSEAYNKVMSEALRQSAKDLGIKLQEGVYCAFHGPEYETPAEVRLAQVLGADAVGMSTVPEVLVANHMGMKVAGISCLTNKAAGLSESKLSHDEVMETGRQAAADFVKLLAEGIRRFQ
ncbi:MAG: purine-nucleoside phosphorylase [Proteobacteria bacterium]|nr:purine-nucleoside phosphorylase [Pseudomonadota bacterium]